jgi:hypothetical protein
MQTILISVAIVLAALAFAGALALFFRLTAGASGLRGRIQRLFRLPEKVRPRAATHYYHAYWGTR